MRDALAVTWAMVFPSVMTWVYFVAMAGPADQRNLAMVIVYGLGKTVQFAFPLVFVALTEPRTLRPTPPGAKGLRTGLAFGVVVGLAALAIYFFALRHTSMMRETPDKIFAKLTEIGATSVAGFIVMGVFISVGHSLLEEYYWRWFVFGWLKRNTKPWPALVLGSLGFMAHHVIVLAVYFPGLKKFFTLALPFSLGAAIGGGVWCYLYQRTGSLYATWLSHALIDGAIMVIGYDLVSDKLD